MFEVGRVVVKIAGRDAKSTGVIVDVLGSNMVLVDGQMRRRKVNTAHLEPLNKTVKVSKGASSEDVAKALKGIATVVPKRNSHPTPAKQARKVRSKKAAKPVADKPKTAKKADNK